MRFILIVLIGLISLPISAQELKNRELKTISKLGINTANLNIYDEQLTNDFKDILRANRKRKSNKTVGIVLTSLSALTTTFGALLIANSKDDEEGLRQSIGIMFVAIGTIELGISIPLFISSSKRKRERDLLIKEYKDSAN